MPNDNSTMGERFDRIFWKGKDETAYWKYEKSYKTYIEFIKSEIDRAVGEERERTSKIAKEMLQDINFLEGITGKENMDLVYKNHKAMKNYLSLITKQS